MFRHVTPPSSAHYTTFHNVQEVKYPSRKRLVRLRDGHLFPEYLYNIDYIVYLFPFGYHYDYQIQNFIQLFILLYKL